MPETQPKPANAKFDGFFVPQEKPAFTFSDAEVKKFQDLPKGIFAKGRFEQLKGNINRVSSNKSEKIVTQPIAIRHFIKDMAAEHKVSPWDVAHAIRAYGAKDDKKREIDNKYRESIAYISDLHGTSDSVLKMVTDMEKDPPNHLIFEGDVLGSQPLEDLQRLFYNGLTNHSKNEILQQKPDATDTELLAYGGTKPPEEGFTVKKGFLKLREFELRLAGKKDDEIKAAIEKMSDAEIANEVRRYAKYVHYGHYASNLPEEARKELAREVEVNAGKLLAAVKTLEVKGTKIVMLEGNWDAAIPIDFEPNIPTAKRLPKEKRLFSPSKYFQEKGVNFKTELDTYPTDTSLHVVVPFDALTGFSETPPEKMKKVKDDVEKARAEGKAIIMVTHGEPNWKIHNMTNTKDSGPTPGSEHDLVTKGNALAIKEFRPDELIYGHYHDPLTNEAGEKQDLNTKYALRINEKGEPELVPRQEEFKPDQTVASFMQLQKQASVKISRKDKKRKVERFGGHRQPAKVK